MQPEPMTLTQAFLTVFPQALTFDGGRYLIATLTMVAILWVVHRTSLRVRRIQQRRASAADIRREVTASAVSVLVYALVATPALWLRARGYSAGAFEGHASGWVIAFYVIALLIAHDAWFYWTHRLMHDPRLFRRMHRLHHRSTTPTPFAAYAFAAPEAAVHALFIAIWISLIPTPDFAIFVMMGFMILRNVIGHAGTELHPRGMADHWLGGLLTTTVHHDLHHAGGFNTNYALYFTWWDRMMGTEHPRYREIFREVTSRRLPEAVEAPETAAA